MKKILTLVVAISVLVTTGLFAQGSNETTSNQKKTVTFWTMSLSPSFDDYLNGVIEEFETQNPNVEINWIDVPWGDTETRVLTAATSNTLPDVINLNLPFSQKLAQNDLLIDMNEKASDVKDDYFEGCWNASTYNGKVFALPWYITSNMVYYNKALFEQAGLDPNTYPTTFDELYSYAKQIHDKTGAYGYMTFFQDQFIMEELERMGIRLFNEDFTKAQFNTPQVIAAANYYKKMLDEKLIPSETITSKSGTGEAIQLYSTGELAMFFGGTSHARMIKDNSQEIYNETGVAPQIIGENGKSNIAVMNIVVPKSSKVLDEALAFSKFLTNNTNQVKFAKAAGAIVPSTKESLNDAFFSVSDNTAATEARIMSAKEVSRGTMIFPPMQNWTEIRDAFIEAFAKAATGNGDASQLLQAAQDKANSFLSE
ncbi:MAG: ABC transporter substrate-binding protein [Pleomorphochaeta sp.]